MPAEAIVRSGVGIDLSSRLIFTTTVVASPAAAAETIIAQTGALSAAVPVVSGVFVFGWAAYTVGTSGTTVRLRVRQTGLSGTVVADTGAMSGSQHGAAIVSSDDVNGFDTAPAGGQVYVLTMQVANAAAISTVSSVLLGLLAV